MTIMADDRHNAGSGDTGTTAERHPAGTLVHDDRVQRALIPARVRRIKDTLATDGIGVITVSRRENGDLVILDGQHRVQALIESGMNGWEVDCLVHHGLDLAGEARQFRLLNDTRRAGAYDDFIKGVLEGDAECVAINDILHRHDLELVGQSRDGGVRAVAALRALYKLGPVVLDDTLAVAVGAWGRTIDALDGKIVRGIGIVLARYGDDIDRATLTRKLSKFPGGALSLLGDARGLHKLQRVSVDKAIALIIVGVYNRGKRSPLPPL